MKKETVFPIIALVVMLTGCVGTNVVKLHKLPNYQANSPLIVFLDFKISKASGNTDKVTINNAIVGVGEMRPQDTHSENPIQIKAVLKATDGAILGEWFFDHPLHREVEVSNEKGAIERKKVEVEEGIINLRFQQNPMQQSVELYRIGADKSIQKIFNLELKP